MKRRGAPQDVPQVIAIVQPTRANKISLKKIVREFLQAGKEPLYLVVGDEVRLSARPSPTAIPVEGSGSRITLPEAVIETLGLTSDTLLAILEREGAVALKRDQDHAAAEQHLKRAVERDPRFTKAHYCLALVYLTSGRIDDAEGEIQQTLRLSPGHPLAHAVQRYIVKLRQLDVPM